MGLSINQTVPDFTAETTEGTINFHEWIGDSWAVLFSHPKDFTPICTTELGYMARIKPEFDKRGVKIIGLSVDPLDRHAEWAKDIEETQGTAPNYPLISDADFAKPVVGIASTWSMVTPCNMHIDRLADDHARARTLAQALRGIRGVEVQAPHTNMVFVKLTGPARERAATLGDALREMRADFHQFPEFAGGNAHYPMLTRAVTLRTP